MTYTERFLTGVLAVQRAIDFDRDVEFVEGLIEGHFPGCSYGVASTTEKEPYTVTEANVNIFTQNGTKYDMNWMKGHTDVRLTRWVE